MYMRGHCVRHHIGLIEGAKTMADNKKGKTITVEQIGSPAAPSQRSASDADRPGPQQDAPPPTLEDTPSVRGMIRSVSHLVRVVDEK
jgi:large subunit ribosomal protein L30